MASALRAEDTAVVGSMLRNGALPDTIPDENEESGPSGPSNFMSERQQCLNLLWRHYRCTSYDGRKYDWHGNELYGPVEHDVIATSGTIPAGFYDAGQMSPLEFRRPLAPYYLGRVIPDRFTGMLFSAKRHPALSSDDPVTQDWLEGFAEVTRFWAQMIQARTFGGAMGSVGLGYKYVNGRPYIEIFDPRFATPEFSNRELLEVKRLEILYQYSQDVMTDEGVWAPSWFWYRRVIDRRHDMTWPKVRVEQGVVPNWLHEECAIVDHGLPHCPVIWIQNSAVLDNIDGDPDCHGVFDMIQRIDTLMSQADRGTVGNCDPSICVSSDSDFDEIKKGTGNAMQVEKGGSITYVEMSGTGIDRAMKLADVMEEKVLTMTRCVLDRNEGGPARTETEVEHNYSAMIEQADIYREQYGEKGIKRLLEMVLESARDFAEPHVVVDDETGHKKIVRTVVKLPKKRVTDEKTGRSTYITREIGHGMQIDLIWPTYFVPSQSDVAQKVEAVGKAKEYGLIDEETAVKFIARDFSIENVVEVMAKIKAEQREKAKMGMGLGLTDDQGRQKDDHES